VETHDQLAQRRPRPGDRATLSRKVEAAVIELFTRLSGDHNPLHYDEQAARASRFGVIIVQGGVTSAILNAVVAERLPGPGTVFLNVSWDFLAPVRPGDEITAPSRSSRPARTSPSPSSAPP
jgi:acyl dehydratase